MNESAPSIIQSTWYSEILHCSLGGMECMSEVPQAQGIHPHLDGMNLHYVNR